MVQTVNVTVDDYSPVIQYSPAGAWIDGNPAVDSFWDSYTNNGTFTTTVVLGASATFEFSGTAIWVFGAKRSNHGAYNVTLDGDPYQGDGFYDGQIFQQVLFSAKELDGTIPHTFSIINSYTDDTKPFLDIDSIVYEMEIPDDYQLVRQQDTDGDFRYSQSGWSMNPESVEDYDDGTGHSTSLGGAYVNYTFQGTHVELNGVVGPSGGVFTVQLDDDPEVTLNASRTKWTPKMILYQQSGLSEGDHILRVTNGPFSGQTLSIDYASLIGAPNSTSPSPPASSSSSSSLSGGVIGGIVAGTSGLLIVTMVLLLVWYRRRHRQPTVRPHDVLKAEFTSENGDNENLGNSSTQQLTPYLDSTITRYRAASPPIPISLPGAGTGNSITAMRGPELYQSSYYSQSQLQFPQLQPQPQPQFQPQPVPGPPPGMRFVVRNADGGSTNGRGRVDSATEEKRRLAAVMRERDNQSQEFGQGGSGN